MPAPGKTQTLALAFGVGFLSAAVLMVELLLTRLFSVTMYYHFAFMAVSVAMLGLGAGGLLVYLNRDKFPPEAFANRVNTLNLLFVLGILLTLLVILNLYIPAKMGVATAWRVALIFLVTSVPFLFAGALLSLLVWRYAAVIHRLYYYDLLGAAAGSFAVLPGLELLGAPSAVLFAMLLAAVSATLLGWSIGASPKRMAASAAVCVAAAGLLLVNVRWNLLDMKYAKGISTKEEIYARWNAISRVCVHKIGDTYSIRIDCDAATAVPTMDFWGTDRRELVAQFSSTGQDLAHVLRPGAKTLVIGSGGGRDVARALAHGSSRVVAVEINPLIARDLMLGRLLGKSHRLFERPEVELVVDDARSAIQRSTERFDVMQSTLIDTWASTAAGAFALTESYLYTLEAFELYLRHLSPGGILIVTRWEFVPPRQALRVVSLGRAALERMHIANPAENFVVVQDPGGQAHKTSVLIKTSPFTADDLKNVRAFLRANPQVRTLYLPDAPPENQFTALLQAPELEAFLEQYPFDISPPPDSRPFFFFTTRWKQLPTLFRSPGEDLKNNVALFILAVVMLLSSGAVVMLMVLPRFLRRERNAARPSLALWSFFLAIGVAYIVAEIVFIQNFILFMGHPTYGITVVIFSLLVGSGLGSRWSGKLRSPQRSAVAAALLLAVVLTLVHLLALPQLFSAAQQFSRTARGLLSLAVLLPLGFVMGLPFPLAVRSAGASRTAEGNDEAVLPWFWSANAAGSVFGSVAAILLAMSIGIPGAGVVGALGYAAAAACLMSPSLARGVTSIQ